MQVIAFYILAGVAVLASLGVIGQRNPMHSVMLLIVAFGAFAGLYILLDAPFSAVGQSAFSTDPGAISSISSVGHIGSVLYSTHAFAFEVTSILILVSMVGAVVIAGRPRRER